MDFILPDDSTMDIMRQEFEKLKTAENARAFALADSDENAVGAPSDRIGLQADSSYDVRPYIATTLLLLYFVKHLGYNTRYGIQIFDTDRGLEQLQCVGRIFRQLNDLD